MKHAEHCGEGLVVLQYTGVPARHDRRNARRRAALAVLDETAGLRWQDLGDIGCGQVPAPAVVADGAVLQQPQLLAVPGPFHITGHVVEGLEHPLQEVPQGAGAQAPGGGEMAAFPAAPRRERIARCGLT